MADYRCKICDAPATMTRDGIVRSCDHSGPVVTEMRAVCYGKGNARARASLIEEFHALGMKFLEALRAQRR